MKIKHLFIVLSLFNILYSSTLTKNIEITLSNNSNGLMVSNMNFKNLQQKVIKYLWVEIIGINRVGDILPTYQGSNEFKITGPIEINDILKIRGMDYINFKESNTLDQIQVRVVKIEYMEETENVTPGEIYLFSARTHNSSYWNKLTRDVLLSSIPVIILFLFISN
jgi:hypothetical protein